MMTKGKLTLPEDLAQRPQQEGDDADRVEGQHPVPHAATAAAPLLLAAKARARRWTAMSVTLQW